MAEDLSNDGKKKPKKPARSGGPTDDLELLREIVISNKGIYLRVLDKIREIRAANGKGVIDEIKEKQKVEKEKKKKL
jgi:hypothetical protein